MFVDADLFNYFYLEEEATTAFSYSRIGLFNAILDGLHWIFWPTTSFSEALSDVQHPLVAYCGDCSGVDYIK